MSVVHHIYELHAQATATLQPEGRSPTRAERAAALELADTAVELALISSLSAEIVEACERFQHTCYGSLQRLCSRNVGYERHVYDKSSSKSKSKSKSTKTARRVGRVYDTDPGEHLTEAFQAVRLDEILQEQEARDREARLARRRIHWSDQK
ncbi:hypothetical protein F4806DRAFT_475664 [Annulohypoxylon nitens]|nr:hypothetical protein F4806DRAFT_475664 [Annulohypoxylon nitens]